MKLVGGSSECDGRVQIRYNEQWAAVCHSGWDLTDATVLCRELDCGDTAELKEYEGTSGQILMGELACTGKELTVQDCPFAGWGVSSCLNGLHAGVSCQSKINLHVSLSNDLQLMSFTSQFFRCHCDKYFFLVNVSLHRNCEKSCGENCGEG